MCDYENAVNIWFDLVDRFDIDGIFHFEELAKYFEHKARDYNTAISIVQKAIQKIEVLCELSDDIFKKSKYNVSMESLRKRLARLKKKQNKLG
jgi:cell shape-determining protein MreC